MNGDMYVISISTNITRLYNQLYNVSIKIINIQAEAVCILCIKIKVVFFFKFNCLSVSYKS